MQIHTGDIMLATNQNTVSFSLSADSESLFRILSDTLYSRKELAVVRELSTNALDANRMVGKEETPIEVHVPHDGAMHFSVRDFGPGLSEEDIVNIYTKYGESTKKTQDNMTGFMGVGSKSPFAVAEMFTVKSYFGGILSIYIAKFIAGQPAPTIEKVSSVPSDEPSGLEVIVPAKPTSKQEWHDACQQVYNFFDIKPKFKNYFNFSEKIDLKEISPSVYAISSNLSFGATTGIFARMGQIAYRIDIAALHLSIEHRKIIDAAHPKLLLDFAPREIDFSANREQLSYTARTIATLTSRISAAVDSILDAAASFSRTMSSVREIAANYYLGKSTEPYLLLASAFKYSNTLAVCDAYQAKLAALLPGTNFKASIRSDDNLHVVSFPSKITKWSKPAPATAFLGLLRSDVCLVTSEKPMTYTRIMAYLKKVHGGSEKKYIFVAEKDGKYKQSYITGELTDFAKSNDFFSHYHISAEATKPRATVVREKREPSTKLYSIDCCYGTKVKATPQSDFKVYHITALNKNSMKTAYVDFRDAFGPGILSQSEIVYAETLDDLKKAYASANMQLPPSIKEFAKSLLDNYVVTPEDAYCYERILSGSTFELAEKHQVIEHLIAKHSLPILEEIRNAWLKVKDIDTISIGRRNRQLQYVGAAPVADNAAAIGVRRIESALKEIMAVCPELELFQHCRYSDSAQGLLANLLKR